METKSEDEVFSLYESLVDRSTAVVEKLKKRLALGKPLDILVCDIDGTLYKKVQNDSQAWVNQGDNSELSVQLKEKSLPLILNSGIPDWSNKDDQRMRDIGLDAELIDTVIVGGGTTIYWKNQEGKLVLDDEFSHKLKEQDITLASGEIRKFDPTYIMNLLSERLLTGTVDGQDFATKGVEGIRVDTNPSGGYTTLDLKDTPLQDLLELKRVINATVPLGIRVEFNQRLDKEANGLFSGWLLVVPTAGGKDGATRYVLEKISAKVNPNNAPDKKPIAHAVGDADIRMLAMGTGEKHPYQVVQYALGNLSPHAREKLVPVIESLKIIGAEESFTGSPRAHLQIIKEEASEGTLKIASSLQ